MLSDPRNGLDEKALELPRLGVSSEPPMGNCEGGIRAVLELWMDMGAGVPVP